MVKWGCFLISIGCIVIMYSSLTNSYFINLLEGVGLVVIGAVLIAKGKKSDDK